MNANDTIIDQARLAPWLKAHISGFSGLNTITKFDTGQSNPTFLLAADSGKYVLRTKPPGELLKSAHQVDREFKIMQALANTPVPVPKVFVLCDEDSPIGRMFFVMEFLEGRIFWDPAIPELGEGDAGNSARSGIYDAMNRALAALHDVDIDAVGLSDFGRPGNYFARQLSRWSKQYHASELERIDDVHALITWLEKHLPADDGRISLVHGDYRIDNMIFAGNGTNILGILDWELSTVGHPLADLAYQCMQWRLPNQGTSRGLAGMDRAALGIPTEEEYVAEYCRRRCIKAIDHWTFYLAFCFFRLAAIVMGVARRGVEGNASDPVRSKRFAQAVPLLAAAAHHIIREDG